MESVKDVGVILHNILMKTQELPMIHGFDDVIVSQTPTGEVVTITGGRFDMEANDGDGQLVEYTFTITRKIKNG